MFLVYPKEGKRVRDPDSKQVLDPEVGHKIVSINSYWARRALENEVTIVEQKEELKIEDKKENKKNKKYNEGVE